MYVDILTLLNSIYGVVKSSPCYFKEYINTMTFKAVFNQRTTYYCSLYIVNDLGTVIITVYINDTMEIGDKPELINKIECIKK